MWNKFKTFVKKEIDEFKQDQENKKKIENLCLTQTEAKIRFIKLLELQKIIQNTKIKLIKHPDNRETII